MDSSLLVIAKCFLTHFHAKMEMTITGPNDSSLAMNMWSSTFVKMVGSMKNPKMNRNMTLYKLHLSQTRDHRLKRGRLLPWTKMAVIYLVCLSSFLHRPELLLHLHSVSCPPPLLVKISCFTNFKNVEFMYTSSFPSRPPSPPAPPPGGVSHPYTSPHS